MKDKPTNVENARHEIARAAEDAVKAVASAAADAAKLVEIKHNQDHDMLVRLDTKMEGLKSDIADLKDGTSKRIDNLERNKLDVKDSYRENFMAQDQSAFKDLGVRLTALEDSRVRVTVLLGMASGIMTILIGLLVTHIFMS